MREREGGGWRKVGGSRRGENMKGSGVYREPATYIPLL